MEKKRTQWIIQAVKLGPPWHIVKHEETGKVDTFIPGDPERKSLIEKKGYAEADLIECRAGLVISSGILPFETKNKALQWLRDNADNFYFFSFSSKELKDKFPEIPVIE
ncbi:MAG: hypothetical protein KAW12_06985 [Candidatus Aminicenantes bacterium]|nr:hypothetical protein [Candidatus Aminicenantes bacterium]